MVFTDSVASNANSSIAVVFGQRNSVTAASGLNSSAPRIVAMNKTSGRRSLTAEERDDAARLGQVYKRWKAERKKDGKAASQEALAHLCDWSGQSAVSQYTNARIPLNLEALSKLSRAMGVPAADISPRLAAMMPSERSNAAMVDHVVSSDDGEPSYGEVDVPYYREVELAAGAGQFEVVENHGYTKRLPWSALVEAGVSAEDAACATLVGDSMWPVIHDGTPVGIDRSFTRVVDGELYAFDHDGMLRVKYLYRMPMNRLRIVSQNADEYPDEIVGADDIQFIRIIGRVFWWQTVRPKPPSHLM